jgi:hypothetical protein
MVLLFFLNSKSTEGFDVSILHQEFPGDMFKIWMIVGTKPTIQLHYYRFSRHEKRHTKQATTNFVLHKIFIKKSLYKRKKESL